MFLVNSAWTSSSSALPSNAFQQIVGPEELPESLLDQRDKKARGGPTSSAGGVGARRSSNTSDYQGGGGGVDIYTYPFQQQTADNHNMREIPMEDLEIAMKVKRYTIKPKMHFRTQDKKIIYKTLYSRSVLMYKDFCIIIIISFNKGGAIKIHYYCLVLMYLSLICMSALCSAVNAISFFLFR